MTSVDTLVNATEREGSQIKQPPDSTIEKVSFLFNNLSQSNLPKKASLHLAYFFVFAHKVL